MGIIVILIMFGLIALGVPITFSLGVASLVYFTVNDVSLLTFAQKFAMSVDSFALLALPFFILAGNLMNQGGVTKRLFDFCDSLVGFVQGGLSYVTVVSSVIFSAISGSALANAAGLGTLQIRAMKDKGYDKGFSTSLVTTAAVLGPVIPPSILMIIYGVTAGVSVQRMFIAGILPGLIYALMCCVLCKYYGKKLNLPKGKRESLRQIGGRFLEAIWALLAPVIILAGILSGVFTPTESGAIASVYVIIVAVFIYRELTFADVMQCLLDTAKTTGTILLIAATASLLGFCMTFARVPMQFAAYLTGAFDSPMSILFILMLLYLFLGTIMEGSAVILTTVPIFIPLCQKVGIDLVYFGVFVSILMSIATVTPPVGTVMFVICRNNGLTVGEFTRNMLPWFGLMFVFCALLVLFPEIITAMPKLFLK